MDAAFDVVEIIAAMALAADSVAYHCTFHAWRVAILASKIAQKLTFPSNVQVFYAGLLHDLGAISLDVPLKFFPTPREQMKNLAILEHPIKGSKIVAHIPGLKEATNFIRYHHEWFDGSGYPFGLQGSKIPLGAQIIRLADAVDITYRDIRGDVVKKMAFLVGREFSEKVWEAFLEVIKDEEFAIAFGEDRFLPELFGEIESEVPRLPAPKGLRAVKAAIKVFGEVVDARHRYTGGHSQRVAFYTEQILRELSFPEADVQKAYWSALLHDIGKIAIPKTILDKPKELSEEEWKVVEKHPVVSTQILERVTFLKPLLPTVFHHHERWDGRGYPRGLRGSEIPILARVMAIADAFDAMTSERPYRSAISPREALREIWLGAASQFDPELVRKAEPILSQKREGWLGRLGASSACLS
jgi:putative nucleotidyltransferase with HDIG domain